MRTDMIANIDPQTLLSAFVDSTGDAIIITDPEGTIRFWNKATESITGYTEEEALGRHISFMVPDEAMAEENALMAKVLSGQHARQVETRCRKKDGGIAEIVLSASAVRAKDGSIAGVARIAREVTGLREAERQGAYLAAIVDSSDDAIIAKDFDSIITAWNAAAERIFGYSAEEAIGNHISIILPPERLEEEKGIIAAMRAGQRIDHFETVRRAKNGNNVDVSITVSPIRDARGVLIGVSNISRDVTERKRTERQLAEVSRRKDEFLANMSHELRTPMNAIMGLSDLLAISTPLTEQQKKFIATLKTSSGNLLALINDLLDFSRLEQGELRLEQVEFSLTDCVDHATAALAVRAEQKGLALRITYGPGLRKHFIGDPLRLQQIMTNLVANAVKFTERGSIDVNIAAGNSPAPGLTELVIEVADTGIGVPEESRDAIFDKFYQAEASITRKYGGSGLGLAIVKAIVTRMGGTVTVQSQVGVGSTFTVRLPLRHSGNDEQIMQTPQPRADSEAGRRVLIVEDYEPNAMVAAAMLDNSGYSYEIASGGREALNRFQHGAFDAVLMDLQMPGLDGFETTRRIRNLERESSLHHTPIIAVTAHTQDRDKEECLRAGMDDFIAKPYNLETLAGKLQHVMSAA